MAQIFVSYRPEDTGDLSPLVVQWLAAEYSPAAVAHDVSPGLTGDAYMRALDPILRQGVTAAVVHLVGPRFSGATDGAGYGFLAQPGDRPRIELEMALARSLPIMPVLVDDTPALRVETLPESLYPLAAAASLPLHSRAPLFENEMRQIIATTQRWMQPAQSAQYFVETPATPPPQQSPAGPGQWAPYDATLPGMLTSATPGGFNYSTPTPPPAPNAVSRRAALGGFLGLGVVLAGAGAFWLVSQRGTSPSGTPTATGAAGRAQATSTNSVTQGGPTGQIGERLATFGGHTNNVDALAFSPDGRWIASGAWDDTVQVWDAATGAQRLVFTGHSDHVISVAWSPDGRRIVSASDDGTARVWDAQTGAVTVTYTGHGGSSVWSVAWSPDGSLVASGGRDNTAQVWNPNTGDQAHVYTGHGDNVRSVCWSPDGSRLATASYDHTARVWDVASETALGAYTGHTDKVWVVGWSADGASVASGGDTTVHVWDPTTFAARTIYRQHTGGAWWLAWSPRGRTIASCSADTTARLWDADSGATAYVYRGHTASVNIVGWSHDAQRIASGSDDHTVQVWRAS